MKLRLRTVNSVPKVSSRGEGQSRILTGPLGGRTEVGVRFQAGEMVFSFP
jgi:hypothetical protein